MIVEKGSNWPVFYFALMIGKEIHFVRNEG